LIYVVHVGI